MRVVVNGETVIVVMTKNEAISLGNDIEYANWSITDSDHLPLEGATRDLALELINLEWVVT